MIPWWLACVPDVQCGLDYALSVDHVILALEPKLDQALPGLDDEGLPLRGLARTPNAMKLQLATDLRLAPLYGKPAGHLLVHEVYRSIPGESTFAGLPCVFVRLTACSARCTWWPALVRLIGSPRGGRHANPRWCANRATLRALPGSMRAV
jgi:hypothetical protein